VLPGARIHLPRRPRRPATEAGATVVEYALMAAVVVAVFVAAATQLAAAVGSRFDHNASCASVAYRGGGC
jgi:Flp pilus assembly pilin Flp